LAPDYLKNEPGRERFAGILPHSYSHEGYNPPAHSYWDDFWALKGWKDGRDAADVLGKTNVAEWAQQQYQLLRDALKLSIDKTMSFKQIDYLPASADKGDLDVTSTTIAFYPCQEQNLLPQQPLRKAYYRYFNDVQVRMKPGWSGGFTPYEIRNVTALTALGHGDNAMTLLENILASRRPRAWNQLAEVVLGDPRMGSYIGDMPHTWVGSGFIEVIRTLLAREEDGKLVLLKGMPLEWVRNEGLRVEGLPTYYGTLNMTIKTEGMSLLVDLKGDVRAPKGIVLYWPFDGKPKRVLLDGEEWADYDTKCCRPAKLPKKLLAIW
jgi:hypothetical protein